MNKALESKQYCSAAFLDISQAFDKVWHTGPLYKLRRYLPLHYFLILKSYLHSTHFLVKVETEYTELSSINAGVPRRSVIAPLLYLLYTAEPPTSPESTTATLADDTVVVTMDSDPADLLAIQNFLKMVNETQWSQVDPRHIHYTKRNMPSGPYKQCATPPRRRCQVSWATPWQETYLAETYFRNTETTRNHPH
jgi:hypothetical protein